MDIFPGWAWLVATLLVVLSAVLIGLKLFGVITIPWWLALTPLAVPVLLVIGLFLFVAAWAASGGH